ncbi:hypothetical protein ES705_27800 [subsurface metagenome]
MVTTPHPTPRQVGARFKFLVFPLSLSGFFFILYLCFFISTSFHLHPPRQQQSPPRPSFRSFILSLMVFVVLSLLSRCRMRAPSRLTPYRRYPAGSLAVGCLLLAPPAMLAGLWSGRASSARLGYSIVGSPPYRFTLAPRRSRRSCSFAPSLLRQLPHPPPGAVRFRFPRPTWYAHALRLCLINAGCP